MVEWWGYDARRVGRIYVQLVLATFILVYISAVLAASAIATSWPVAIVISASLLPVSLSTATILSQRLLRCSLDTTATISRSSLTGEARPKCTLAIPSIVCGRDDIDEAVNTIRHNIIRNHGATTYFCVAFDFFDCEEGSTSNLDDDLLFYAKKKLAQLEDEVSAARGKLVAFFRHRLWSPSEESWIGWERKRGKIIELCRLIRRGEPGSLFIIHGESAYIRNSTYLMILDSDSWLEHGGLNRLIDAMHDQSAVPRMKGKILEAGYIIGCPRGLCRPGENTTTFSKIMFYNRMEPKIRSLEPNFFQDVLGHHIFVGKGLYDVSAFLDAVDGRLPPDRVLSHDHLEGMLAIPVYISDVYFYQSYPQQYSSWRARQHRWIRGDMQTIPWIILPGVRGEGQSRLSLSLLDRLKLAANIANHLTQVGQFVIFVTIALGGVRFPPIVTLAALAFGTPGLWIGLGFRLVEPWLSDSSLKQYLTIRAVISDAAGEYKIFLINFVTLADVFVITVDAMARAVWRMSISGHRLLEWRPSSIVERSSIGMPLNRHWMSQVISISVLAVGMLVAPASAVFLSPAFLAWAILPSSKWVRTRDTGFL
ncbi:hypothetical protein MO327_18690 [Xanthomonas translucens]|uniref:hypothetical protein n=1 Tax=Xanthomonas campestris pv. translucens TaxID=343 RepID=UPI00272CF30E|nr:hypothetical protein [Xanthomonas translucens]WLA12149.1 hypothetical protein MO327_18690 [Xanthomonas translucens]